MRSDRPMRHGTHVSIGLEVGGKKAAGYCRDTWQGDDPGAMHATTIDPDAERHLRACDADK